MSSISFGTVIPGKSYTSRPGAYVIVFDEAGRVGVVENPKGYFLLGGGIEGSESPEDCVHREVREEIGMSVELLKKLGTATQYIHVEPDIYVCKEGHFYFGQLLESISETSEDNHILHWLPVEVAIQKMYHQSHKWAIEQAKDRRTFA